ncbi:MAG: hypothetical protein AAB426_03955 [Myxococcota bacterium]
MPYGNRELFSEYASLSLVQRSGMLDAELESVIDSSLEELRDELRGLAARYVELANNGTPLGSVFPHARVLEVYEELRDAPLADALELLAGELEAGTQAVCSTLLGADAEIDPTETSQHVRCELLRQAADRLRRGAVVSLKNPGQEFLADAGDDLAQLRAEFPDLFAETETQAPLAAASMVVNIAPSPAYFGDGVLTELLDEMQDLEDRLERLELIRFDAFGERWVLLDGPA